MALTLQEQTEIIYQLGWPGKTLIAESTDYNNTIVGRFVGLNSAVEGIARSLMSRIKGLDERLSCALDRLAAKVVQDITMNEREMEQLRLEKRKMLNELSDLLGIPVVRKGGNMVSVCS